MDEIKIRIAQTPDVDSIVSLNHALFQEDAGQRDRTMNLNWALKSGHEYFDTLLKQENVHCLIAQDGEDAVGYLIGYLLKPNSLRSVRLAELESMFVKAEARSSGIGAEMMSRFMAWCKEKGVDRVGVTAYAANARAIAFYQRHGFEPRNLALEIDLRASDDGITPQSAA